MSPKSEHRYKLDIALQRLRTFDGGLVVFDNVERLDDIQPYLPLPEASPHLLLTSRVAIHPFVPVPLDLLSDDQAYELLRRESGRQPVGRDAEAARGIAVRLGGLPLALELAGSYLARFGSVSFADYARLFEEGSVKVLELGKTSGFTKHDADLASSLAVHERALEEAPALREVLDVLTWGASAPMSENLLAAMLPHIDTVALMQALALGSTLRILQPVEGEKRYALHRLVTEVRRAQTDLDLRWASEMAERVAAWFREQRNDFTRLTDYEAEFDQLEAWRSHVRSQAPVLAAELLWLQAYPAYHRGQGAISNQHVAAALQELQSTPGDLELEAHLRHDLSTTLSMMGRHIEALELADQALAIRRSVLGEQHPDTAHSLDSVGVSLSRMGRHSEALPLKRQALAILRKELGGQHPETAQSLDSIGATLSMQGQRGKAVPMIKEALRIMTEGLGPTHPRTVAVLEHLVQMARPGEGFALYTEIRKRVAGMRPDDPVRDALKRLEPTMDPAPTVRYR